MPFMQGILCLSSNVTMEDQLLSGMIHDQLNGSVLHIIKHSTTADSLA